MCLDWMTRKKISGFYTNGDASGLPFRLNVDYTAFDEQTKTPPRCFPAYGSLKNTNTIEEFRTCDKKLFLEEQASSLWNNIISGKAVENPGLLSSFFVLTYADLKKYHYYYWFAFPALCAPDSVSLIKQPQKPTQRFNDNQISNFLETYERDWSSRQTGYFLLQESESALKIAELKEFRTLASTGKVILCMCDPCTLEGHPGWPLRNLLTLVAYHWADVVSEVEVLCFRNRIKEGSQDIEHSIIFTVSLPSIASLTECPRSVGWEKNERQKLGPRIVNLSASMDPSKLAESAVDLNLKLMRWRLLPDLDLKKISETRCLLLGSGTLGCNVARCLLGWGVRTITLVDNAKVSYSNPVRQTLFTFEDSLNGGRPKAEAAAESLRKIFPGVNATGHTLSIPMPGHPVPESMVEQTKQEVIRLEELVDSHDVIFLLMDTRESRWLPTLLASVKQKIVINAALGFDTFLVQRHGLKLSEVASEAKDVDSEATTSTSPALSDRAPIPGHMLGCYYCNDVVAPGDSTRDRTLDQQCTVSRPGMSFLAASLAVELLVSCLQHPDGGYAPAETGNRDELDGTKSALGIVPHQIRGFLSQFHLLMPVSQAYNRCTACSQAVIDAYRTDGIEMLLNAFNSPTYLEDLTGLTQLHIETNDAEVWELSDDDSDISAFGTN